ncbi:hypothetical protein Ddc_02529 [Ditylenchus destructor]|nr:hypothetical protein Ddc_02529 [Ditylenchus destructor]
MLNIEPGLLPSPSPAAAVSSRRPDQFAMDEKVESSGGRLSLRYFIQFCVNFRKNKEQELVPESLDDPV